MSDFENSGETDIESSESEGVVEEADRVVNEYSILSQAIKIVEDQKKLLLSYDLALKKREDVEKEINLDNEKKVIDEAQQIVFDELEKMWIFHQKIEKELLDIIDRETTLNSMRPINRDLHKIDNLDLYGEPIPEDYINNAKESIKTISSADIIIVLINKDIILKYKICSDTELKKYLFEVANNDAKTFLNMVGYDQYEGLFTHDELMEYLNKNPELKNQLIDLLNRDRDFFVSNLCILLEFCLYSKDELTNITLEIAKQNSYIIIKNFGAIFESGIFSQDEMQNILISATGNDKVANEFMRKLPFFVNLANYFEKSFEPEIVKNLVEKFLLASLIVYKEYLEKTIKTGIHSEKEAKNIAIVEFRAQLMRLKKEDLEEYINRLKLLYVRNN